MLTLRGSVFSLFRLAAWIGGRLPFLRRAGLTPAVCRSPQTLLNLPTGVALFPTRATELSRITNLLSQLYPISCSKPLIRLGPKGDGGYLVPDDLDGISACLSPGVSKVSGFEKDCAELGMEVFMADASVDAPAEEHPRFHFVKKFIGSTTRGDFISFADWITSCHSNPESDLLLQIDIEGFEYESFLSVSDAVLRKFRIIVVEFHRIDFLFSEPLFNLHSRVFEKLLNMHRCVHIHPNNCSGTVVVKGVELPQMAEFTFYRRDRIENEAYATQFPHPLDCDNTSKRSVALPRSMFFQAG
jgi:hypothetical protein